MPLDFYKLPGFSQAAELQDTARDWPFLDAPIPIAGAQVLPLTLRQYTMLSHAKCKYITGGIIEDEDALALLWVVSTEYQPGPPPKAFTRRFVKLWNEEERDKLDEYVDLMFLDSGGGGVSNRDAGKVSAAAQYVFLIAPKLSWTRDQVLDTPMPELNQYVRCIQLEGDNAKDVQNKLTDKLKADWMREINAVPVADREEVINRLAIVREEAA